MKVEIKNRFTGKIIFECEADSFKLGVEMALKQQVAFIDANLSYKDLRNLNAPRGSRFDGSSFVGSCFDGSSFVGSRFDGSRFDGSSFVGSRFDGSSFVGSSFVGSRFDGSTLASLLNTDFDVMYFRDDLWAVLSSAPREAAGLLKALEEGRINGSTYEGECACLVGTIANVRGCNYNSLEVLKPNAGRPAEQWFLQIKKGDTPASNKAAEYAHAWISEWIKNMEKAFGPVAAAPAPDRRVP